MESGGDPLIFYEKFYYEIQPTALMYVTLTQVKIVIHRWFFFFLLERANGIV
jgi:hypothetical protein